VLSLAWPSRHMRDLHLEVQTCTLWDTYPSSSPVWWSRNYSKLLLERAWQMAAKRTGKTVIHKRMAFYCHG